MRVETERCKDSYVAPRAAEFVIYVWLLIVKLLRYLNAALLKLLLTYLTFHSNGPLYCLIVCTWSFVHQLVIEG